MVNLTWMTSRDDRYLPSFHPTIQPTAVSSIPTIQPSIFPTLQLTVQKSARADTMPATENSTRLIDVSDVRLQVSELFGLWGASDAAENLDGAGRPTDRGKES